MQITAVNHYSSTKLNYDKIHVKPKAVEKLNPRYKFFRPLVIKLDKEIKIIFRH